ncbi:MAG: acyl carrier protein [Lachnospiraceae bacterium]|nr:acyl carrier protein [Lachnospiraceae bacterium]
MLERISELMRDKLGIPDEMAITEDISFKDDLLSDSFEMTEFIMAVEDEYRIEISEEEFAEMETVGDLINCINDKPLYDQ